MYLIGQGGNAQPYPAAAHTAGRRADGTHGLLTARALTSRTQAGSEGARHWAGGAERHGVTCTGHFVHRGKEAMQGLALKVPET